MKKLIFTLALIATVAFATVSWAAWTFTPSVVDRDGGYITVKIVCLTDGAALTSEDLLALTNWPDGVVDEIRGGTWMETVVVPGTSASGTAPDSAMVITFANPEGVTIWTGSAISNTANTIQQMNDTLVTRFPNIRKELFLTMEDDFTTGDVVTLILTIFK